MTFDIEMGSNLSNTSSMCPCKSLSGRHHKLAELVPPVWYNHIFHAKLLPGPKPRLLCTSRGCLESLQGHECLQAGQFLNQSRFHIRRRGRTGRQQDSAAAAAGHACQWIPAG